MNHGLKKDLPTRVEIENVHIKQGLHGNTQAKRKCMCNLHQYKHSNPHVNAKPKPVSLVVTFSKV